MADKHNMEDAPKGISRRSAIKGVIAAGAVSSSGAYLFRTSTVRAQQSAAGSVERLVTLNVNGQQRRGGGVKQETPNTTLRYKICLPRSKMGRGPPEKRRGPPFNAQCPPHFLPTISHPAL